MLELCLFQKNEPKMETKNKFKSTIWDTFFWRNVWCQNYSKPNLQESSIFPVWHTLGVSTLPVKMFGLGQKVLSRLAWSKGLVQLLPRLYSGWGFLPSQWDRQHMLLFWFREASQNLSLFRQLFFHWRIIGQAQIFWSICWKFQLSISLGRQNSPSTIQPGQQLNKPFWNYDSISAQMCLLCIKVI